MLVPLWYLLVPFGVLYAVCSFFIFFNFFHIAKFGLQGTKTAIVLAIYVFSFVSISLLSIDLILRVDWTQELVIDQPTTTLSL
jgi:hypothetical protein